MLCPPACPAGVVAPPGHLQLWHIRELQAQPGFLCNVPVPVPVCPVPMCLHPMAGEGWQSCFLQRGCVPCWQHRCQRCQHTPWCDSMLCTALHCLVLPCTALYCLQNNQYMVVDLNKFVPGEALRPGLLWVAEQVPGLVAAADMTPMLAFGYWPSFNVPFFPEVGAVAFRACGRAACLAWLPCGLPCAVGSTNYCAAELCLLTILPEWGTSAPHVLSTCRFTTPAATPTLFQSWKSTGSTLARPRTGCPTKTRPGGLAAHAVPAGPLMPSATGCQHLLAGTTCPDSALPNHLVLLSLPAPCLSTLLRLPSLCRLQPPATLLPRRAKIFRRDQAGVHDLAGMKAIMRGNSWKSDPVRHPLNPAPAPALCCPAPLHCPCTAPALPLPRTALRCPAPHCPARRCLSSAAGAAWRGPGRGAGRGAGSGSATEERSMLDAVALVSAAAAMSVCSARRPPPFFPPVFLPAAVLGGPPHLRGVRAGRPGPRKPGGPRLLRRKGHQLQAGAAGEEGLGCLLTGKRGLLAVD
jgi:hypothetical protein